jgi:hypothetical protein
VFSSSKSGNFRHDEHALLALFRQNLFGDDRLPRAERVRIVRAKALRELRRKQVSVALPPVPRRVRDVSSR